MFPFFAMTEHPKKTKAATEHWMDADFVAALRHDMLRFSRLQLRDPAQAEDAVQDALMAAFAQSSRFSGQVALKTWVFGILKHKIVDQIRVQHRTTNASAMAQEEESLDQTFDALFKANAHWTPVARPSNWGNPAEALEQAHFWVVFDACLNNLPANTARVFSMREFLELETPEICQELAITPSHCNVILHRARNALRRCLEKKWFTAGEQTC